MQLAVFSTRPYDRQFLARANAAGKHELVFIEARLEPATAPAAAGSQAVCAFVNDRMDASVLQALQALGVRLVALRSAGFNHVDLAEAARLGLAVAPRPGPRG